MKVLVYGYYHKQNLGDDLFQEAFKKLFPAFDFTFVNKITTVSDYDLIIFGGGSLLEGDPQLGDKIITELQSKKICYIGVGTETKIHPTHISLLNSSKLIATRSKISNLTEITASKIFIPDLVYSLCPDNNAFLNSKNDKNVMLLPNITVVPTNKDPIWKWSAWNYFKSEFAQFLDYLVSKNYKLDISSMCTNPKQSDYSTGMEITNHMVNRNNYSSELTFNNYATKFQEASIIITQRYHGSILSQIFRKPHLTLFHHDKLSSDYEKEGIYLSYYQMNKNLLIDSFHQLEEKKLSTKSFLSNFKELQNKVGEICDM